MSFFYRFFGHLKTISKHKFKVGCLCIKCGLIKQGLLHDCSKYSPIEFNAGVHYYQGFRSPIDAEKEELGFSKGWLHHKGRNPHHWEYWTDKKQITGELIVQEMPLNFLLEAACDKICACKIYNSKNYYDGAAFDFLEKGKDRMMMGDINYQRHYHLLKYLKDNGEKKTIVYYKSLYKKWKKDNKFNI